MKPLWVFSAVFLVAQSFAVDKARVFITDSQSWEIAGSSAGTAGTFAGTVHGGARPQTAEIIKTFGERCPDVIVNNKPEKADYVVVLDHEGGKGLLLHRNKVAVFNHEGDAIVSRSTRSLGNSVKDACEEIVKNWNSRTASGAENQTTSVSQPASAAAFAPSASKFGTTAPVTSEPSPASRPIPSTTRTSATLEISSTPSNADIDVDGNFAGNTSSSIGVAAGEHTVKITKNGYKTWERKLRTSAGTVRLAAELEPLSAVSVPEPGTPALPLPKQERSAAQVLPALAVEATTKESEKPPASIQTPAAIQTSIDHVKSVAQAGNAASVQLPSFETEGTASVTSNPNGAEIFVDSVGFGHAPSLLKLKPGKHRLQLVAAGYKDWITDIEVTTGSIVNVTGTLEK